MIDSWNAAQLNERIDQVEKKIRANDVIANPTGAATADLGKVSIDGDIYGVSVVKANPEGSATGTLSKVSIDGTVYKVEGSKTLIWENPDPSTAITSLSDIDVSGYTQLEFVFAYTTSVKTEITTSRPNGNVSQQVIVANYNIDGGENTYTVEELYRTVTISEGTLSLSNGLKKKVTDGVYSTASSGSFLIPLRIYGY